MILLGTMGTYENLSYVIGMTDKGYTYKIFSEDSEKLRYCSETIGDFYETIDESQKRCLDTCEVVLYYDNVYGVGVKW
jgi:hypothetical protein